MIIVIPLRFIIAQAFFLFVGEVYEGLIQNSWKILEVDWGIKQEGLFSGCVNVFDISTTTWLWYCKIVFLLSSMQWRQRFSRTVILYLLKVSFQTAFTRSKSSLETRVIFETFSKLTIKIPEQRQWRRSGGFIGNFEHISHIFCCYHS